MGHEPFVIGRVCCCIAFSRDTIESGLGHDGVVGVAENDICNSEGASTTVILKDQQNWKAKEGMRVVNDGFRCTNMIEQGESEEAWPRICMGRVGFIVP
jgi:hypothetical protein